MKAAMQLLNGTSSSRAGLSRVAIQAQSKMILLPALDCHAIARNDEVFGDTI